MADIIDKHRNLQKRVRKLELEMSVREGISDFASLKKHSDVIAEHLCRPTTMSVPYGRLAALLFAAEQEETNYEILRLLRVLREKMGVIPWIGNQGQFRGPNFDVHTSGYQFNGFEGSRPNPSPLTFVRYGKWLYPVVLPTEVESGPSHYGSTDVRLYSGATEAPFPGWPVSWAFSSIGGAPIRDQSMQWLPLPMGVTYDGGTIDPGSGIDSAPGYTIETESTFGGPPVLQRVRIPHHSFVLGRYIYNAPSKIVRAGGAYGGFTERTLNYETGAIISNSYNGPKGQKETFPIDAGPPESWDPQVYYHLSEADQRDQVPFQDRIGGFDRRVFVTVGNHSSATKAGKRKVRRYSTITEESIRGPYYEEADLNWRHGTVHVVTYQDGGISAGSTFFSIPTDEIRAGGPPIVWTPALSLQTVNDFQKRGGEPTIPWVEPTFAAVVQSVEDFLAVPRHEYPRTEDIIAAVPGIVFPKKVNPRYAEPGQPFYSNDNRPIEGQEYTGFPLPLLFWYEKHLGLAITETRKTPAVYPGTSFPADADTYQHEWTEFLNDATGHCWYIVRHGWVHLKGFVRNDAGALLGFPDAYLPDTINGLNGIQQAGAYFPIVAEDGTRTTLSVTVPSGQVVRRLYVNNGGPGIFPYFLDGIKWPIA